MQTNEHKINRGKLEETTEDIVSYRTKRTLAARALRKITRIVSKTELEDKRGRRVAILSVILLALLAIVIFVYLGSYQARSPVQTNAVVEQQ